MNKTKEDMELEYPNTPSEEQVRLTNAHYHWITTKNHCRICGRKLSEEEDRKSVV